MSCGISGELSPCDASSTASGSENFSAATSLNNTTTSDYEDAHCALQGFFGEDVKEDISGMEEESSARVSFPPCVPCVV